MLYTLFSVTGEIFTSNMSEKINSAENSPKLGENSSVQIQNVLLTSHVAPVEEKNMNSDCEKEIIFVNDTGRSVEALNGNTETSPIKDLGDQMQFSCSADVDENITSTVNSESGSLIDMCNGDAENRLSLKLLELPVLHHESSATSGGIQGSDVAEDCKSSKTEDDGTNTIIPEEVLKNDGLLVSINNKRKLEISESEFSSKKLKEDTSDVKNGDESSSDISDDFMNNTNIEQLVSNVTVADIKAVDRINQLIPWNPAEKIETTRKTLDRIALNVCEEIIKECYKRKYYQGKNEVKELEKKITKLTNDLEKFRAMAKEFSSSQKVSFADKGFEKITSRTVGVNVKILKESDVRKALEDRETKNKALEKDSNINKSTSSNINESTSSLSNMDTVPENDSNICAETISPAVSNNDILPENASAHSEDNKSFTTSQAESSALVNSNIRTEGTSPVHKNVTCPVSASNNLLKISSLPHITPVSSPVTASSLPATIPLPEIIKDGDRLIPYLNPSKSSSSQCPPILLGSLTTSVTSTLNSQITALQKEKPVQNGTVHNGAVMPNTTVKNNALKTKRPSVVLNLNDFMKMLKRQHPSFPQQRTSLLTTSSSQPHAVKDGIIRDLHPQGINTNNIQRTPSLSQSQIQQLVQLRATGNLKSIATRVSAISQQPRSSHSLLSPSPSGGLWSNKGSHIFSHYPVSTFSPTVRTHQTSVPLQSLTRTMPHPSTVMSQPITSLPYCPTYIQQPVLPLRFSVPKQHSLSSSSSSQQHSVLLNQNKASIDEHFSKSLQQCPTSVQNNLASLQHLTTSLGIHHNPMSAMRNPYFPFESSTYKNGSSLVPKPIDSQSFSSYPVSTFSPAVRTHQTSVPLQSLTRTMPHPSTVMSQPITSLPFCPTYMQQPALPPQFPVPIQHSLSSSSSSQQHSSLLNQNKASVDQHTSLQQSSTSEKNNLVSLQHLTTSSSIHDNSLSARPVPCLPLDSSADENGSPLLPKPIVKASIKDNGSVVISWNLTLLDHQPEIAFYQIYSCQEQDEPEDPPIWNSVGDVASLDLPMACTLRHFAENARYHFAVRIVDKSKRYGPFSDPVTILYEKGKDSSQRNSAM